VKQRFNFVPMNFPLSWVGIKI